MSILVTIVVAIFISIKMVHGGLEVQEEATCSDVWMYFIE